MYCFRLCSSDYIYSRVYIILERFTGRSPCTITIPNEGGFFEILRILWNIVTWQTRGITKRWKKSRLFVIETLAVVAVKPILVVQYSCYSIIHRIYIYVCIWLGYIYYFIYYVLSPCRGGRSTITTTAATALPLWQRRLSIPAVRRRRETEK